MASEASMVVDLANILSEGLGDAFTVLPATSYVAIIHPELGLAAIVPNENERLAQNAASDLTPKLRWLVLPGQQCILVFLKLALLHLG